MLKSEKSGIPLRHKDKLSLSSRSGLVGRASWLDKDSLHHCIGCSMEKPVQTAEEWDSEFTLKVSQIAALFIQICTYHKANGNLAKDLGLGFHPSSARGKYYYKNSFLLSKMCYTSRQRLKMFYGLPLTMEQYVFKGGSNPFTEYSLSFNIAQAFRP